MGISQGAMALAAFLVLTSDVQGEQAKTPDRLLRAVGLALTGSFDVEATPIDRAHCVFAVGKEVFHLNNVYTDGIDIRLMGQATNLKDRPWVRVELHGDPVVYENENVSAKEYTSELQSEYPGWVAKAWSVIYSDYGCVSKEPQ
jgi:hypothetical protein